MGDNDTRGVANLDSRGIDLCSVQPNIVTYKNTGFMPCGFREEDFNVIHIIILCQIIMPPGVWPIKTPGALLAGFIKGITKHCYTQYIIALVLVVSEKIIFMFFPL